MTRHHAKETRPVSALPRPSRLGDAMLVLGMIAMLATFIRLISFATVQSERGRVLARATTMATTLAEKFASSPSDACEVLEDAETGLVARRDVTREATERGVLYRASIEVTRYGASESVYEVVTARYVQSDRKGDRS